VTSLNNLIESQSNISCSDFNTSINPDPIGTSIHVERIILIEAPIPWPSKIREHQLLKGLDGLDNRFFKSGRILLTPLTNKDESKIRIYERLSIGVEESVFNFSNTEELKNIITQINNPTDLKQIKASSKVLTQPTFLICTHGSRDTCCGSKGTIFAKELASITNLEVLKVSHIGGHRFAPTLISLPDGRVWANLTFSDAEVIATKQPITDSLVTKLRGWWGAQIGYEQVAERELFKQHGWNIHNHQIRFKTDIVSEHSRKISSEINNSKTEIVVELVDSYPTISCKQASPETTKKQFLYESKVLKN